MRGYPALVALVLLAGCLMPQPFRGGAPARSPERGGGGRSPGPAPEPTTAGDGKLAIPDLVGKSEAEAAQALRAAGFASELEVNHAALECNGAARDEGKVNCQDPAPGTPGSPHAIVHVTVFHAPHRHGLGYAETQPLLGLSFAEAKQRLAALGFHGSIEVIEMKNLGSSCTYDTVCEVVPSSFGFDDTITFRINKAKLEIAPPD